MSVAERLPELRSWYRGALGRRIDALDAALGELVEGPVERRPGSEATVREQAHAVAGSGGSYGFPLLSEAGRFVEHVGADGLLPAAAGLADLLRDVAHGVEDDPEHACHGWLGHAAGPLAEEVSASLVPGPSDIGAAWAVVRAATGLEDDRLAARIAERLDVGLEDPATSATSAATPAGAARLLVPPSLALDHGVLPIREDGTRLWAASANPTDLRAVLALRRMTGRTPVLVVAPPEALEAALGRAYRAGLDGGPRHRGSGAREDGPVRVLVVDDEEDARLLARAVLEKAGYVVVEAVDGVDALERLGEAPVDLLVVDLDMPRMDGQTFIHELRGGDVQPRVPAIVLTGVQSPGREVDLIESGADDYLRKPLEPRLFLARVRATLRRAGTAPAAP